MRIAGEATGFGQGRSAVGYRRSAMSFASLLLEPELPAGPDTPGVIVARPEGDEVIPYFHLVDAAGRLAATLADAGVAPRTPVACLLPPSADVVAAFFGTWIADGVYVPVNPRLSDTEIAYVLGDVSPAAVIGSPEQLERVKAPITRIASDGRLGWSVAERRGHHARLPRSGHRHRVVHLGHHRAAQAHRAPIQRGDPADGHHHLHGAERQAVHRAPGHAPRHPGVHLAVGRDLQRDLRGAHRQPGAFDAQVRRPGIRPGSAQVPDRLHRDPPGRHRHAQRRAPASRASTR